MLNQIIVGVAIFIIVSMLGFIVRLIKKVFKKVELQDIKHDGLVYALQKERKNGLWDDYNSFIENKIKDREYIS